MSSTLTQSRSEMARNNGDPKDEPKLEFIKIDDGRILVRVTRGSNVAEAIIHTVPPENYEDDETQSGVPAFSQDAS